jgi:predicted O-methyltransferase YrrM
VNRQLPDNLVRLYETFGGADGIPLHGLLPGDSFTVDGVEFVCDYQPGSTPERFYIVKTIEHVQKYIRLFEEHRGANIFELGIAEGGSTALAALLAAPAKLVAIDNERQRLPALDELIAARGLTDVVRAHWGVDQSDHGALTEIMRSEFAGTPLDLVIDDASHQLDLTRRSFEILFPYLRPGGLYLIEDWNSAHVFFDSVTAALRDPSTPGHEEAMQSIREAMAAGKRSQAEETEPLSQLAIELVLARASSGSAIDEVTVSEHALEIRRGPAALDADTFRVRDLYRDHFGLDPANRRR